MLFQYITEVSPENRLQPVRDQPQLNPKGIVTVGSIVKDGDVLVSKEKNLVLVQKDKGGQVIYVNQIKIDNRLIIKILLQKI